MFGVEHRHEACVSLISNQVEIRDLHGERRQRGPMPPTPQPVGPALAIDKGKRTAPRG